MFDCIGPYIKQIYTLFFLTLWCPAAFGDFQKKNA